MPTTPATPTIGFLHTSPVHVQTFAALVAASDPRVACAHVVDESLLHAARRSGPRDELVVVGITRAIDRLQEAGATLIVCTCSTIGGAAEEIGGQRSTNVVRVDRPMAQAAVATGVQIAVVAAVDSTLTPTRALLESVAAEQGRVVEIAELLVADAWSAFERNDLDSYFDAVAAACISLDGSCDVIVLAQASMAGALERMPAGATPILTSPQRAVDHAIVALASASGRPG